MLATASFRAAIPARVLAAIAGIGVAAAASAGTIDPIYASGFESQPIVAPANTWTYVPFGDAYCGNNSTTGIGVNLSSTGNRVLIFLNGGGACWDAQTCMTLQTAANYNTGYGPNEFASQVPSLNGAPFFDRMAIPIGLVLLFLMAVAPVLPWRSASTELLSKRLWWPLWASVVALGFAVAVGARGVTSLLGFWLAGFAAGSVARQLTLATRRQGWRGLVGRANGGMVVHLGVLIISVALVASQSYTKQGEFTLERGETVRVGGHTFEYLSSSVVELSNRRELRSKIRIDGEDVFEPSMNQYLSTGMSIARPSVKVTPTTDLYLSITRPASADRPDIRVRIVVEPLIVWLWTGGALMAFGSLILSVGFASALVWQSARGTITPWVVEVDKLGQAQAIAPADVDYRPTDPQMAFHLARFIEQVRAIPADPIVLRQDWLRAYDFTTDRGAQALNDYARNNDPFAQVGKVQVAVDVSSVVRASNDSFRVGWTERRYQDGALLETSRWSAILTTVVQPPRTPDALRKNPLGLFINAINWSKELSQ